MRMWQPITQRKVRSTSSTRTSVTIAQYVSDMTLELRNMAKAAKLYKIMVPLEFAYYEAFSVANRINIPKAELERLQALAKAAEKYEPPASAEG